MSAAGFSKADRPTPAQTPTTSKPGAPLMRKQHPLAWQGPSTDFAITHCTKCEAGWSRCGQGASVIVCLLDREPVFTNMTSCDHYQPRKRPRRSAPLTANRVDAGHDSAVPQSRGRTGSRERVLRVTDRCRSTNSVTSGASPGYPGDQRRTDACGPHHRSALGGVFSEPEAEAT
jgi:hypothetical protein